MCTINSYEIELDPAKDRGNRARHGMSLAEAAGADWDRAIVVVDDRESYGEERFVASVPARDRLYVVVFTLRDEIMRVISMRSATRRELELYETQIIKGLH